MPGGFQKVQRNGIKRQKAIGHYRSPYQVGGTIFGRSMQPAFPLLRTRSRLSPMESRYLMKRVKQKGGLVLPTNRRQRGGWLWSMLKKDPKDVRRGLSNWEKHIKKRFL